MDNKKRTIVAITLNLFVFLSSALMTISFFIPGFSWGIDPKGAQCFRYFTIDSNLLCGFVCLAYAIYQIRFLKKGVNIPRWMVVMKHSLTVAIALTFFTVLFFLGPLFGYGGMYSYKNAFLHGLNPVVAMVAYCVFEKENVTFKQSLFGIAPTFVYSWFYLPAVLFIRCWPDFYGFTFNGHVEFVPLVLLVMYAVSWGIGLGLMAINNVVAKPNK